MRRTLLSLIFRWLEILRVLLLVPGASSWEQINSATCLMLSAVLADRGLPWPDFPSVAEPRWSTRRHMFFTDCKFYCLSGNFETILLYSKPSSCKVWILILSLADILPIVKSAKIKRLNLFTSTIYFSLQNDPAMTSLLSWYLVTLVVSNYVLNNRKNFHLKFFRRFR